MSTAQAVGFAQVLYRVDDAARVLGVSRSEVRRLLSAGELTAKYIGKKKSREYRVTAESMQAYVESLPEWNGGAA